MTFTKDSGVAHPLRSALAKVATLVVLLVATGLLAVVTLKQEAPSESVPTGRQSRALKTTYNPGKLTIVENGLRLSEGLSSRIIARAGSPVVYDIGGQSTDLAHVAPDYGATFPDTRASNKHGWI